MFLTAEEAAAQRAILGIRLSTEAPSAPVVDVTGAASSPAPVTVSPCVHKVGSYTNRGDRRCRSCNAVVGVLRVP